VLVAKTLIDIDEHLLDEATTALGTVSKKDTVNEALRKVVHDSRERRAEALANLQRIADEGGFNFDLLDELDQ
jgi:Arc/MetJ family transcription regulator